MIKQLKAYASSIHLHSFAACQMLPLQEVLKLDFPTRWKTMVLLQVQQRSWPIFSHACE